MRKITLLFVLAFLGISVSAQVSRKDTIISNFESGYEVTYNGSGYTSPTSTYTTWKTWSPYKIIATLETNPDKTGLNTSETALKLVSTASATTDELYSAPGISPGIKLSSGTNGYRYFHCKLYQSVAGKMLVIAKPASNYNTNHFTNELTTPTINKWDTINIDLFATLTNTSLTGVQDGGLYRWFTIQPMRNAGGNYTLYIDDIYLSNSPYSINGPGLTAINNVLFYNEKIHISRLDNNTVRIHATESDESLNFKIYNIHGQLLKAMDKDGMGAFEVNLPNNNLYVLQVSGKKGTYTTKF